MNEIHRACASGDLSLVQRLLATAPALVAAVAAHRKTPLHFAAEKDHLEVARALIDAGAAISCRTDWGATPLEWAAATGSQRVAGLILEKSAQRPSFWVAAALGMIEVVRHELESSQPPAPERFHPHPHWPADSAYARGDSLSHAFVSACRGGHVEVAALLLSKGARLDAKGYFGGTALHWAAIGGHRSTVVALLERGADPNARDDQFEGSPAGWAKEGGHEDLVRLLFHRGARISIGEAANWGLVDVAQTLIDADPTLVDSVMDWGRPLHEAAFFGQREIVELLLARGADPTAMTSDGKTALDIATECGREDVAEVLRRHERP